MTNPWLELPETPPHVLSIDSRSIVERSRRLSQSAGAEYFINSGSIPEPFIGNPESASVILLSLNPGDGEEDKKAHSDANFRAAMLLNLKHELREYPFYPLNPTFAWTPCARWWLPRLRQLFELGGLDRAKVSRRLCVIEWFPYHSRKAGLPLAAVCPSQDYSFALARKYLGAKLIVGLRSRSHWEIVHPAFGDIPYLKNPRQTYLSVGNAGENLFREIVAALR